MRFPTFLAAIVVAATAHAQYITKPRAEQVFVKTNYLVIIKSNDLQGALVCIDTNLSNIYSNLITPSQIANLVTSNINENVQTLVFDSLGNFLTNFPHTYNDSSGYQSFYATTTRTDSAILNDLRVDRDVRIGRNLTVTGTVTATGNVTAQRNLAVGTNLTVGGNVTIATNLTVGQSALVVSNLAVAGDLTVTGTVTVASTNVTTINGIVHVGDATRPLSAPPSVIVQYSSADSSNATAQADLGNTNTFASGVSARFLESKWGTIRGALDGAPAEVYPSWRMVYIGSSVGTDPWGTASTNLVPLNDGVAIPGDYARTNASSWAMPASATWTNLYSPDSFGVNFQTGALSVARSGLYRISMASALTNVAIGSYYSSHAYLLGGWTNATVGGMLVFGMATKRITQNNGVDRLDLSGSRVLALRAGDVIFPGLVLKQLYCNTATAEVSCRTVVKSMRIFVEWMPLPSTLLNGVSPSAFDYPVPATQFDEDNAFNILQ